MNNTSINLSQAFKSGNKKPSSEELLKILLECEYKARKEKPKYNIQELVGKWRLSFITGTIKSQQKLSNIVGSGFYLPSFIKICLSYSLLNQSESLLKETEIKGEIENTVSVGLVKFSLTGPTKFITKKNIMAFDFNHLTLFILGKKIYGRDIRGGKSSQEKFYINKISKQAFFSYFLVKENIIAARGKGGGLALWQKETK